LQHTAILVFKKPAAAFDNCHHLALSSLPTELSIYGIDLIVSSAVKSRPSAWELEETKNKRAIPLIQHQRLEYAALDSRRI
jgi:hypothetical protein